MEHTVWSSNSRVPPQHDGSPDRAVLHAYVYATRTRPRRTVCVTTIYLELGAGHGAGCDRPPRASLCPRAFGHQEQACGPVTFTFLRQVDTNTFTYRRTQVQRAGTRVQDPRQRRPHTKRVKDNNVNEHIRQHTTNAGETHRGGSGPHTSPQTEPSKGARADRAHVTAQYRGTQLSPAEEAPTVRRGKGSSVLPLSA